MKLSSDQMMALWRLRRQLEPLRSDCEVSRADGIDTSQYLQQEIDDWYETLLDTAPVEMLAVTDITSQVAVSRHDETTLTISLPDGCRRVVEVMFDKWNRPAVIAGSDTALARRQDNRYSRAGDASPVAIVRHNTLWVYGATGSHSLLRLRCVMQPDDGFYEFSKRALSTISQS